ncbi:MAG: hypothetical protein CMJ62_10870 [Planctomycetaceae bacterium]|nr:hypothetical protein [Planctomycetaceae bacterium]
MQLVVQPDGIVRCVYDEAIDLRQLGELTVQRGSSVEPDLSGRWIADLAVVNGPKLGPFDRRSEALAAERAWLEDHWLTRS